jgi:predicted ATP-dependent serine protease
MLKALSVIITHQVKKRMSVTEFNYEGDYEQKPLPELPRVTDVVSKKPPRPLKLKKTKDLFLNMFPAIKIFMKGAPGSGKSSFALMLADDFALNGNVLYILAEETLYRGSLASRIKRMKVISPNIEFLELKLFEDSGMTPREEILQRLNSGKYQYVIVDSMNVLDDYKIISQ